MRTTHARRLFAVATGSLVLLSLAGIAATSMPIVAGSIPDPAVRIRLSHGPGHCQTALPVFDGNVRKRPLAIANEGTGSAFLTCDFDDLALDDATIDVAGVFLVNQTGAPGVTVACTLVDGSGLAPNGALYLPKVSAPIPAGGGAALGWNANSDNGGDYFEAPALSCSLPAGVAIVGVVNRYLEDVGT